MLNAYTVSYSKFIYFKQYLQVVILFEPWIKYRYGDGNECSFVQNQPLNWKIFKI